MCLFPLLEEKPGKREEKNKDKNKRTANVTDFIYQREDIFNSKIREVTQSSSRLLKKLFSCRIFL